MAQMPPPTSHQGVLGILGDQYNASYPIFQDEAGVVAGDISGEWTLGTVSFDLRRCQVSMWVANPRSSTPYEVLPYPGYTPTPPHN